MTCWDIIWPQIYVTHEPKRIFLLHLPSKHKKTQQKHSKSLFGTTLEVKAHTEMKHELNKQ